MRPDQRVGAHGVDVVVYDHQRTRGQVGPDPSGGVGQYHKRSAKRLEQVNGERDGLPAGAFVPMPSSQEHKRFQAGIGSPQQGAIMASHGRAA